MIITNQFGHPAALVDAVTRAVESYDAGPTWMSLTSLFGKGPKLVAYERGHPDWTQVDVDELLHSFVGTVLHDALERASTGLPNHEQEHRLFWEIQGKLISGKFDELEIKTAVLRDWKSTSVWSFALGDKGYPPPWAHFEGVNTGGVKPEWAGQTNGLKWLIDQNIKTPHPESGKFSLVSPTKLEVFAILLDHSRSKVGQADYPISKGHRVEIPIWDPDATERAIRSRIQRHVQYEGMHPDAVEDCSPDETWQRPAVFAVMTPGRKSSHRNLSSRTFAELYIEEKDLHKKGAYIEERPGTRVRCKSWCPARHVCPVGQREQNA